MNPEKSFKVGAVRASIFLNRFEAKDGGTIENYSVNLHRRFEDKEGKWKSTATFRLHELPQVRLVLQLATEYVAEREADVSVSNASGADADEAGRNEDES